MHAGRRRVRQFVDGLARPVVAAVTLAAALVCWQVATVLTGVPTILLPAPTAIAGALQGHRADIAGHLVYTTFEIGLGWLVGVGAGVAFAGVMAASRRLRLAVYPLLLSVRIVPLVAIAPLLIVAFGATLYTRVLMAAILTFFPVTVASLDGLLSVPSSQLDLLRSVEASTWARIRHVRLPNALPSVFAGVKIATPLAVEGVLLAEFLAASRGLGYAVLRAAADLETALVFAHVTLIVGVGLTLFGFVSVAERLLRWSDADGVSAFGTRTGGGDAPLSERLRFGAVALCLLAGLWVVGTLTVPNADAFLPAPPEVASRLLAAPGLFASATLGSLSKLAAGWALGAAVGGAVGALVAFFPRTRPVAGPFLVGTRVTPTIVAAPLLLVWFGISVSAATVLIALATFFPIAVATASGLTTLPETHRSLLDSVAAPRRARIAVRLRYGVPTVLAGVKLSLVSGLSGVVIAEWFVANGGLGVLVNQGMRNFQPSLTYAAIVCLFALGLSLFGSATLLQRRLDW
ncbi:ABC-type nitrate/sulfonate/bicarbonate transport system, permease component [Haloplanus vescus]|uniref:ABC-type nitrate/sulfonate/bicarbonate transport system, permease component n=1 Tax=Haloplanus vescus TaxID=555874 RepID=A0A1H3ZE66_9EURY|nr:ABC-type nitrate/sulfonate/bicarbonate transport system, permease component [Haloplanus vescus]